MRDQQVQQIVKIADDLFATPERTNNENMWSELSEFMLNNQWSFNRQQSVSATDISSLMSTTAGTKKTRRLFDSTALQAVQDLSAAFQGTLTNPATVWSTLRYQNDELNNNSEASQWLEKVNDIIHNQFNESNFDTEIAKGYQSLVCMANMPIFHEEKLDEDGNFDGFRFTALHLSKVAWLENKDGIVDTVYRKFTLKAKQAVEKWGSDCPHEIMKVVDKEPHKEFQFLHAIFPRKKKDVKLNELGLAPGHKRPWASMYISIEGLKVVEEGGYYEMPVYVARWSILSGEMYGRGPSHLALPDVRTLNRLKQRGLEAMDLQVRPPILANERDVFGQLDLRPGGISIVKDVNGVREFVSQARADILQFSTNDLIQSIKSMFFLDKIQPLSNLDKKERMSQFEVTKRLEEMQSVLGPVLSRLNSELLQPLLIRSFKILLRSGLLPEAPSVVKDRGINIEIVFVNQLARSQQIQDVSSIQQWVANLAQMAQISPEVIDNINADGIARHTAKILGVPQVAITDQDVVQETRQQRAQQQQQQAALEQANLAADTAVKAGGLGNKQ